MSDPAPSKASKAPEAPKTPEISPASLLGSEKLESFKGVGDIMKYFEAGEWEELATAIQGFIIMVFGTPEQQAELAKAKKEAQDDKTKKKTKKDLKKLGSKVDKKKKAEKAKEKVELVDNPKLGDGSDLVLIGDSIPKGMRNKVHGWSKSPLAIAEGSLSTGKVLGLLKGKQTLLKGKKRAIIHCGANNIGGNPKTLVQHIVDMAKICHKHKVQEIIVASQFPADPRRGNKKKIIAANTAFRDELIAAKKRGDFPSSVRIADLTSAFANEKGEMMEKYVDRKANDPSHPRSAYGAALDYMLRGSKSG